MLLSEFPDITPVRKSIHYLKLRNDLNTTSYTAYNMLTTTRSAVFNFISVQSLRSIRYSICRRHLSFLQS